MRVGHPWKVCGEILEGKGKGGKEEKRKGEGKRGGKGKERQGKRENGKLRRKKGEL